MKSKRMAPETIRNLIIKSGFNQASIARDLNVTESLVSRVIDGKNTSGRVSSHIARCVGLSETAIFGTVSRKPGPPKKRGYFDEADAA